MATGYRLDPFEFVPITTLTASFPRDLRYPKGEYGATDSSDMRQGIFTNTLPISELPRRKSGVKQHTFFDDFYERIYLLPNSVNFGSVTDDTEQAVVVWNAHTSPKVLRTIVPFNATGLQLIGQDTPNSFAPMQYKRYYVRATPEGPAYIDARYTFQFDGVEPHSILSVFGSRAELWRIAPNWSNRYELTYAFSTDIFTSRSGKEQRRALRSTARMQVEFEALGYGDSLRWFNRTMTGWQRNAFLMPEYTRSVRVTSPMPAGAAQLTVDEVPSWLVQGASVVLVQDQQSGARLVESVAGNLVTFTSIGPENWIPGAKLHPGLSGRIATDMTSRRLTSEVGSIAVIFNETPGDSLPIPLPSAAVTYNGVEVVLHKPNYASPLRVTNSWQVENVDFNRGRTKVFSPVNFGTKVFQAEYLRIGRDSAQEFLNIFRRMKGRRGSFYMPTWENDLPPIDPISVGSFRIRTRGVDVERLLRGSTTHRCIAVFSEDGDVLFNRVEQIFTINDERGEDTILALAAAWPRPIPLERIQRICWMPQWRFGSDSLTVSWITDEVASITTSLQMLEDLP